MRLSPGNALWTFLILTFCSPGCQTGQDAGTSALSETRSPRAAIAQTGVAEELGPVTVLKPASQFFPKPNADAKLQVQQAGYEFRGAINEVQLRHANGQTATAIYFEELKSDGVGSGILKIRAAGDDKAIVMINGVNVGECTILEPVVDASTISYGRPVALDDGQQVPIGRVKVGNRIFNVISRCRFKSARGRLSEFVSGPDRSIWNDYELDGNVVAKRVCPPEESAEFSADLSPEEQLCIAADMRFRLAEDRVTERQKNTTFVQVYY